VFVGRVLRGSASGNEGNGAGCGGAAMKDMARGREPLCAGSAHLPASMQWALQSFRPQPFQIRVDLQPMVRHVGLGSVTGYWTVCEPMVGAKVRDSGSIDTGS
jgi:hypothetical protein